MKTKIKTLKNELDLEPELPDMGEPEDEPEGIVPINHPSKSKLNNRPLHQQIDVPGLPVLRLYYEKNETKFEITSSSFTILEAAEGINHCITVMEEYLSKHKKEIKEKKNPIVG